MNETSAENERPKVLLGELPELNTPEARTLMDQMSAEDIQQATQMLAILCSTNFLAGNKPFTNQQERLDFAKNFEQAYRQKCKEIRWHDQAAAEVLIKRILVRLPANFNALHEEFKKSEEDWEESLAHSKALDFSSPLEYLKARYGLKDHQIHMVGTHESSLPVTLKKDDLEFLRNSIFNNPPPETKKRSTYKEGRTITLPLDDGGNEEFTVISYGNGNYHDLIGIERKRDGKQFLISEGYIDLGNKHTAIEKIKGGTWGAVEGIMSLGGKTLDLISASMVTMFAVGSIRPTFMEGSLRLIISPRATVYNDPRQPENQTFKGPNIYITAFKKLKANGVKLITPKIMHELGFKVPSVSIEGVDNVQLRDHTRIKAAMTVGLPIVVDFSRNAQSYN